MTLYEAMQAEKCVRSEMALAPYQTVMERVQQKAALNANDVSNLAFAIKKANSDIEHLECEIEDLNTLFEFETDKACAYRHAGDKEREVKCISKIIGYRKRIHNAETALAQAKLTRMQAQAKLHA